MLEKIIWVFLIIFPLVACTQSKEISEPERKTYPPYPDVWGYDLSEYPAFKWGGGDVRAYRMEDGDIWFIISTDYKIEDPLKRFSAKGKHFDEKYILIKFFKQELIELTKEERSKLFNNFSGDQRVGYSTSRLVTFKTGETLEIDSAPTPKLCFVPDFISHYLIKTNADGIEKKYTILASSPQVQVSRDRASCEVQGAPFLYQKLYFLPGFLIGLEDDTFLVFDVGSNLILRFDKNMSTSFQPRNPVFIQGEYINRNFFVLDYSVIKELQDKYISEPIPLFQTVHDALLVYLENKFANSNEENNNDN